MTPTYSVVPALLLLSKQPSLLFLSKTSHLRVRRFFVPIAPKSHLSIVEKTTTGIPFNGREAAHFFEPGFTTFSVRTFSHGPKPSLDRFPKVRSFIAEREFLEGKAREGSWSGPMTAEQRCHREILSGI